MSFEKLWEQYGDKKTTMQYPYDSSGTNRLFDGTIHEIIPREMKPLKLGGRDFEVMRYYDITMDTEAVTLLTRIGNSLAKVPLDDYNILFDYLDKNNITFNQNNVYSLPNIVLAQTLSAQDLLTPPRVSSSFSNLNPPRVGYSLGDDGKEIYRFNEYVPLGNDGTGISRGSSYESPMWISEPYDTNAKYVFNKAPSFADKDLGIQNGIMNLSGDKFGIHKYEFSVDVKAGTTATVLSTDDEGRVRAQLVLLIPGIHEYTITYAPCKYRDDYSASKKANTMLIKAPWPEYRDLHDKDIAFYDGCRRILPLEFYNADGKRINDGEDQNVRKRW